jgi:hypothetical protein
MSISKKLLLSITTFMIVCIAFSTSAQPQVNKEYQVKAAFLLNFTRFIEWPPSSFASEQAPIVIGILGANPFGNYLNEIIIGEKVGQHPLVVQQFKDINDMKSCHILFINKLEHEYLVRIAEITKGKDVLTVSDAPDFLKQGGMVRFFTRSNKMQFQINLDVVKKTKLDISSKLLRLSEIYVP